MSDQIHDQITAYALWSTFGDLSTEVVGAAKARILDTLGALAAGFDGTPCMQLRHMASELYRQPGATIVGTARTTSVDMAAFVNGTTARYAELNDTYHVPGKPGVHPSDVILPLLAVGEYCRSAGPEFLTAVVAGYEVCLALAEAAPANGFDNTNWVALGVAVGSAILLKLSEDAIRQCISLVVVSGNALLRSRRGDVSPWKSAASGHAGSAGVFAALLAAEGIGAPTMPFSGTGGWLEVVARHPVELVLPEPAGSQRILATIIKPRAACGAAIPAILAAEAAYRQGVELDKITEVVVQTYRDAYRKNAVGDHHWAPATRETADHSIPYVVAAALVDGTVGPSQYNHGRLHSAVLRDLIAKVRVEESAEFTEAYESMPVVHRTRVSVSLADGETAQGESGGRFGDISDAMSAEQVADKFNGLVAPILGSTGVEQLVQYVNSLEALDDVGAVPHLLSGLEKAGDPHVG
jgi:2-methylcitrate dehydratase